MCGIAKQHGTLMVPVLGLERGEADPLRVVREERSSIQVVDEELLTVGDTFCLIGFVQACLQPGCLVTFNDEGASRTAKGIGMHLKQAMFVLAKDEGESVKHFLCTQPDIPGFP